MDDNELESGLKMSWVNANGLIEEADLLYSHNYFCRAYTLYQLAAEELGKCKLLTYSLTEYYLKHEIDEKFLKKYGFRDHMTKTKIVNALLLSLVTLYQKESGNTPNFFKEIYSDYFNSKELNEKKNHSLYVSIINEKFVLPESQVKSDDAIELKRKVKIYRETIKLFIKPKTFFENLAIALKIGREKYGEKASL